MACWALRSACGTPSHHHTTTPHYTTQGACLALARGTPRSNAGTVVALWLNIRSCAICKRACMEGGLVGHIPPLPLCLRTCLHLPGSVLAPALAPASAAPPPPLPTWLLHPCMQHNHAALHTEHLGGRAGQQGRPEPAKMHD